MNVCFLDLCTLESVNRWRLSTAKVLLELKFGFCGYKGLAGSLIILVIYMYF